LIMLAFAIIHFALSLGAIYAVIPIIIIIILILAARGAVSGADLFTMFGVNTLLGAQRATNPKGAGKGIAGRPYRTNASQTQASTQDRALAVGAATIGHKVEKRPIGGWKVATGIIAYSPETGKPIRSYENGKLYNLDKDGILLDAHGNKIPYFGEGRQRSVPGRGLEPVGLTTAIALLTQNSILPKNEDIDDAIDRTREKEAGGSILDAIRKRRAEDAADANFMLEKLGSDQLDAAVKYFNPAISAADLRIMSDREKRVKIMRTEGTSLKKLKDYFDEYVKAPDVLAGTPPPLTAPQSVGIHMAIGSGLRKTMGFYREYGSQRRPRGRVSKDVANRIAILDNRNVSNEQLEGMRRQYGLPEALDQDRRKLVAALASRLSDKQIFEYISAHPSTARSA